MMFYCEPNTILDSDDWGKIRIDKIINDEKLPNDTLEIVATVLETGEQIRIPNSYDFWKLGEEFCANNL